MKGLLAQRFRFINFALKQKLLNSRAGQGSAANVVPRKSGKQSDGKKSIKTFFLLQRHLSDDFLLGCACFRMNGSKSQFSKHFKLQFKSSL